METWWNVLKHPPLMNNTLANLEMRVYAPNSEPPTLSPKRCLVQFSFCVGSNTFFFKPEEEQRLEEVVCVVWVFVRQMLSFGVTFHFGHTCQHHDFTTHCGNQLQPFPTMLHSEYAEWQQLLCFAALFLVRLQSKRCCCWDAAIVLVILHI